MYSKLNLKTLAGMTPTAIKLYEYAASQSLPASIAIEDYQRMCGFDPAVPGWSQEVDRICRELVSASVVKSAYLHDGVIHLQ